MANPLPPAGLLPEILATIERSLSPLMGEGECWVVKVYVTDWNLDRDEILIGVYGSEDEANASKADYLRRSSKRVGRLQKRRRTSSYREEVVISSRARSYMLHTLLVSLPRLI